MSLKNTAVVAFVVGSSLISQSEAAGSTLKFSGAGCTLGNIPNGYRSFLLQPGNWMVDWLLNNQTTATAIGLTVNVGNYTGTGLVSRTGAVIDVATPANTGAGLYSRVWIGVPIGCVGFVNAEIGNPASFSTHAFRVRPCTLAAGATGLPSAADVDSYAF